MSLVNIADHESLVVYLVNKVRKSHEVSMMCGNLSSRLSADREHRIIHSIEDSRILTGFVSIWFSTGGWDEILVKADKLKLIKDEYSVWWLKQDNE